MWGVWGICTHGHFLSWSRTTTSAGSSRTAGETLGLCPSGERFLLLLLLLLPETSKLYNPDVSRVSEQLAAAVVLYGEIKSRGRGL